MKNLIITADDFGMCQEVDDAIIELIDLGVVSSTNVIVNMETVSNAFKLKELGSKVSVGIHWNVTTGRPISDISQITSLVDEQGLFFNLKEFKSRMNRGLIKKQDLERELLSQYEVFQEIYGAPDYWNTHENSVLSLKAYGVISKVAKRLNIKYTRNFQRVYIDYDQIEGIRKLREIIVSRYVDFWFGKIIKKSFRMPDARLMSFSSDDKVNLEKIQRALDKSKFDLIELVIHPSTISEHKLFGNLEQSRYEEYVFYRKISITNELSKYNIVSFNDF